MRETGIVTDKQNNKITVKIQRASSCGENCSMCGACKNKEHFVTFETGINVEKGDIVILEVPSKSILKAAFIVYIVPIIFLLFGYYVSDIFFDNDAFCALSGIILMIISFILVHIYDKKVSDKYKPIVVSLEKSPKNDDIL